MLRGWWRGGKHKKLHAGRGTVGKTAVLGMRERGGRTIARPVDGTDAATPGMEIRESIEAGAILHTDEHGGYTGLSEYPPRQHAGLAALARVTPPLPTMTSTAVGFLMGLVPGLAGSVPPWISYNLARLMSRERERFSKGAPEGLVAPEATNAAVMHSTLLPAFSFGTPEPRPRR